MALQNRIYTAVSLFSGAGGLDMGFENMGFKTIWANDIDSDACATHRKWSSATVINDRIENIDFDSIPDSDAIFGGFPCQGFSLSGPRKIDDSRNHLYKYFVKLVEVKQPPVFVAENVKGILTLGGGKIFEAIIEDFKIKGYDIFYRTLNSSDYGVPQDRERVIIVGFNKSLNVEKFNFPKPLDYKISLYDALKEMPEPDNIDVCIAPYSSRYMSRNRKRNWDEVSYTIPAMAKQVPLHPSSPDMKKLEKDLWVFGNEGVTRRFSWREAALIQTFPTWLDFEGDLYSKYRQIGNAVPVKLAESVAVKIHEKMSEKLFNRKGYYSQEAI
jgi:DNA (cytosine-5)-methyltransferase 1